MRRRRRSPPAPTPSYTQQRILYDKVYAFYKGNARETVVGGAGLRLPDGTAIRWSFFVLDNGRTLADSKLWLKVQRPTVVDNEMKDVRDVTSIQLVRKK